MHGRNSWNSRWMASGGCGVQLKIRSLANNTEWLWVKTG